MKDNALVELRRIAITEEQYIEIDDWIKRWVIELNTANEISNEVIRHYKDEISKLKEYQENRSLSELGLSLKPYIYKTEGHGNFDTTVTKLRVWVISDKPNNH